MTKTGGSWKVVPVKTMQVLLDPENPRIDADDTFSQPDIRELLIATEEVVELAQSIANTGANFAGERIIVIKDKKKFLVVEGNRRVCACQLLLSPQLAHADVRARIPKIDEAVRARVMTLSADLAPGRDEAEPVITRRHTQPGIKKWTAVANHRRLFKLIDSGTPIEVVAVRFGLTKGALTRLLREHEVLRFVKEMPGWTKEEEARLRSPSLRTNAFTRFFTLKGAKEKLQIQFDDRGRITSALDGKQFNKAMKELASKLLIPNDVVGSFNTRSTPEEVFGKIFKHDPSLRPLLKEGPPSRVDVAPATQRVVKAKADKFFESLICSVQDNQLIVLAKEIQSIDYIKHKTAASFLLRAILERSLDWCIEQTGLMKDFRSFVYVEHKHPAGFEPGLSFKIDFCLKEHDRIFLGNARGNLKYWKSTKDILNLVVHGKWAQATAHRLEEAASTMRPFIQNILSGHAHRS